MPLLNVSMPANANIMYDLIYTVATFDLPFVGDATSKVKEWVAKKTGEEDQMIETANGASRRLV